jgi:hypothetical protein
MVEWVIPEKKENRSTMISPGSKPGRLLKAMGEYQDQQHAVTGDYGNPTMVNYDWEFHEQRSGLSRDDIRSLLPQLVSHGFARDMGSGLPMSLRAAEGNAWISDRDQALLSEWREPPPPTQIEIAGFGPQAQLQLEALITHASELGVTMEDIDRFEQVLQEVADNTRTDRTGQAANLAQLMTFFSVSVFPLLRNVVEG